jgi:hypothetical protein
MCESEQVGPSVEEIWGDAKGLEVRFSRGDIPSEHDIRRLLDAVCAKIDDASLIKMRELMRLFRLLQFWRARLILYHNGVYDRPLRRTPEELSALTRDWEVLQRLATSGGQLWNPENPEVAPKPSAIDGTDRSRSSFGAAMFSSLTENEENKGEEGRLR